MSEKVVNFMEICVGDALLPLMRGMNVCTCELCQNDVKAFALNLLPPKYFVTPRGMLYTKIPLLEHQFNVDVMSAIMKGIEVVSGKMRHEGNDL
ncbi:MAG: late competence development ComFB family protein [Clostridiales bacterium]|jgi:competence protein ComFB|nr:late competence development ComFB family protein [Clostridiales bacterium]